MVKTRDSVPTMVKSEDRYLRMSFALHVVPWCSCTNTQIHNTSYTYIKENKIKEELQTSREKTKLVRKLLYSTK